MKLKNLFATFVFMAATTSLGAEKGYYKDKAYVDKLALTFVKLNDQEAFDAFIIGAQDKFFLIHRQHYLPDIRSNYGFGSAVMDSLGGSSKVIGLKSPNLAAGVGVVLGAGPAVYKLYDKHFGANDKIMTLKETRKQVAMALEAAEKNGSLPDLMAALGHRLRTNIGADNFPGDIETLQKTGEIQELFKLGFEDIGKAHKVTQDSIRKLSIEIKKLQPTPEEIAQMKAQQQRQQTLSKIEGDFSRRQVVIDTRQSQLTVLANVANAFGVKNVEKPLAIAQFGVTASAAINTWRKASDLYAAKELTKSAMSSANWAMAANMTTAALAAYQMMAGPSQNAEIMAELAVIKQMLEQIDKKLTYLIELSEENFKRINATLDVQRFLIDRILVNTDIAVEKLYANDFIGFSKDTAKIISEFDKWQLDCGNGKNSYCKAKSNLDRIYEIMTSRQDGMDLRTMDLRSDDDIQKALLNLMFAMSEDQLKQYRRYNSGPFLLQLTRDLIDQRLKAGNLSREMVRYYNGVNEYLKISNSSRPTEFINPKIWMGAVDTMEMLDREQGARPNKDLVKRMQLEGQKIARYSKVATSRDLHSILRIELGTSANELQNKISSLKKALYDRFAPKSPAIEGAVYRVPKEAYTCDGRVHGNIGSYPDAKTRETLYLTEQYPRFALLERLGAGKIEQCYYFDAYDGDDRIPVYSYYRFVWDEDKAYLATNFEIPVGNAIKNERLPNFGAIPITHYNHGERATNSKRSTFILALYDKQDWAQLREHVRNDWIRARYMETAVRHHLLESKDSANLDRVIDHIVTNAIAVQMAAVEKVRLGEEPRNNQNELFAYYKNETASILSSFEQYRLRFYLLNAFVQQQALDGRANLLCQNAVTKIQLKEADKVTRSVHPAGLAQALADGIFRENMAMKDYVKLILTVDDTPVCAVKSMPKNLATSLAKFSQYIR